MKRYRSNLLKDPSPSSPITYFMHRPNSCTHMEQVTFLTGKQRSEYSKTCNQQRGTELCHSNKSGHSLLECFKYLDFFISSSTCQLHNLRSFFVCWFKKHGTWLQKHQCNEVPAQWNVISATLHITSEFGLSFTRHEDCVNREPDSPDSAICTWISKQCTLLLNNQTSSLLKLFHGLE